MSRASRVILLNGTSSSGKTTIAKALQARLSSPYLHFCIDVFEEMVAPQWNGNTDQEGRDVLEKVICAFHASMGVTAACGNDLIVDTVLLDDERRAHWTRDCLAALSPFDLFKVGIHCGLEESERREVARGDRGTGLARWQRENMHRVITYDLEIDTTTEATDVSVSRILNALPWVDQITVRR